MDECLILDCDDRSMRGIAYPAPSRTSGTGQFLIKTRKSQGHLHNKKGTASAAPFQ